MTHSRPTQPTQRQHDTCTRNAIDDHADHAHATTTCYNMTEHVSASCRHAASSRAASRAHANHGSRLDIGTPAPLHNIRDTCKQKQCRTMCSCSYPHHCDQPRSRPAPHSPARLLPHCHTPPRLVGWSGHRRLGRSLPTTQRSAVRRGHTCQSWAWHLNQAAGRDRGEQGWRKRSRAIAIAIMRDHAARYLLARTAGVRASCPLRILGGGRAPRP